MQVSIFCELGLKTPIHALKIGVFGSKIEDRGRGGAMLTPNELVLTFGSCYLCATFGDNRSRNATNRRTHAGTETN